MNFADGEAITGWLDFRMSEMFTNVKNALEFTCSPPRERISEYDQRLRKGQLVSILVNGKSQGGFLVQENRMTVGQDGVTIAVKCETPLAGPYEGSAGIKTATDFRPITLKTQTDVSVTDVVFDALEPYGFSQLFSSEVIANASAKTGRPISGGRAAFDVAALKQGEAKSQDGETAYAFCSRIFNRFGVVLRMAVDGSLILETPDYEQAASYSVGQTFGEPFEGDRFLSNPPLEIIDTNAGQHSEVIVKGQRRDTFGTTQTAPPYAVVTADSFNSNFPPYVSEIQPYKPLFRHDKQAYDVDRCNNIATLIMARQAMNAYTVRGAVNGIVSKTGAIWSVNTTVRVKIDAKGLDQEMWVLGRDLVGSRSGGQMTMLTIIPKGALKLGEVPG